MDYEDQLRVWRLLLRNKLAGKIAPAHPRDHRPTEYALLVPDALAVAEVNAMLDTPITVAHLPAILAQFKHLDPPYSSFEWLRREHGQSASGYGYVLVNGVPRWNNGGLNAVPDDPRKSKPWRSQGVSRATWYRQKRETL